MRSGLSRFFIAVFVLTGALALLASGPAAAAKVSRADDEKATQLQLQALDLSDHGDFNGAVEKFRQALAIKPGDKAIRQNLSEALNSAGVAQYQANDYTGAAVKFKEAIDLAPNFKRAKDNFATSEAARLNKEGNELFKASNFATAADKFRQALAAQPDNTSAKANLATCEAETLTKSGDLAGAVAKRREALSFAPTSQMLQGKLVEAEAALATQENATAEAKAKADKDKK